MSRNIERDVGLVGRSFLNFSSDYIYILYELFKKWL